MRLKYPGVLPRLTGSDAHFMQVTKKYLSPIRRGPKKRHHAERFLQFYPKVAKPQHEIVSSQPAGAFLSHLVVRRVGVHHVLLPQLHQTHGIGGAVEVYETGACA